MGICLHSNVCCWTKFAIPCERRQDYDQSLFNWSSKICHQKNLASGDEVGQFDSQFVSIWASIILANDYPFDFFEDWELRKNDILQEKLKTKLGLQNGLLCDGEFFRVHCFASVLNLIVDEALNLVSDFVCIVCKIRKSILFVRGSKSRRQKFKECVENVGGVDSSVRLHLDMSMTVNSTYLMLESALKYQRVFESLHLYDDKYELCPSVEEWK
ncbi:zinc finger BED domain-containing protein RICESLEEPER 2-like [Trifolium pratense]|uniref:zinc finger BED domain-containing protein RICESLEEPER 2-like n=1 Tax=Trifolium pratense TaxID=57577 RepID=UPI001E693C62|nr:zinc finger BED domain-containing protein RICESLEEPER 2-like [Trifolium pratense]